MAIMLVIPASGSRQHSCNQASVLSRVDTFVIALIVPSIPKYEGCLVPWLRRQKGLTLSKVNPLKQVNAIIVG